MTLKILPERHEDSEVKQGRSEHTKWFILFRFLVSITRKRQKYLRESLGELIVAYGPLLKRHTLYRTSNKIDKTNQGEIYSQIIANIAGTEWTGNSQKLYRKFQRTIQFASIHETVITRMLQKRTSGIAFKPRFPPFNTKHQLSIVHH
jgi:hypothetical protein